MENQTTETINVETQDGNCIELSAHLPANCADAPVAICFPAMGASARFYQPLAENLADRGVIAARTDLRGIGSSNEKPSRDNQFGYYEMIWYDYPAVVAQVKERFPGHPVYVLGHSLGGQLATLYAAMREDDINGLILVAAGSVYYKQFGFLNRYGILLGTQTAWAISALLGSFPGDRIGFAGHESYGVIRDWAHQARTGKYNLRFCDHDFESLLGEADLNLLAVSVDGDTLAPSPAMDHLCAKLTRSKVTRWHYIPPQHLKNKIDHFRWVKRSDDIADYICNWIEAQGSSCALQPSTETKEHESIS